MPISDEFPQSAVAGGTMLRVPPSAQGRTARPAPRPARLAVNHSYWMSTYPAAVHVRIAGASVTMAVAGDIDLSTMPPIQDEVRSLIARGLPDLAVDLSAVTFLDCSVLTFLLSAQRELMAAGGSLRVLGENPRLTRLLDITGVSGLTVD